MITKLKFKNLYYEISHRCLNFQVYFQLNSNNGGGDVVRVVCFCFGVKDFIVEKRLQASLVTHSNAQCQLYTASSFEDFGEKTFLMITLDPTQPCCFLSTFSGVT